MKTHVIANSALSKLRKARSLLTLIMMVDELPHELQNEAAHAASVAQRLVNEALEELDPKDEAA